MVEASLETVDVSKGSGAKASADGGTCLGADAPKVSVSGVDGASTRCFPAIVAHGGGEEGAKRHTDKTVGESVDMT